VSSRYVPAESVQLRVCLSKLRNRARVPRTLTMTPTGSSTRLTHTNQNTILTIGTEVYRERLWSRLVSGNSRRRDGECMALRRQRHLENVRVIFVIWAHQNAPIELKPSATRIRVFKKREQEVDAISGRDLILLRISAVRHGYLQPPVVLRCLHDMIPLRRYLTKWASDSSR